MKGFVIKKAFDVPINKQSCSDIIEDCGFETKEDKLICEDIITSLEHFASKNIKERKIVSLPFIGTLRKKPLKNKLNNMAGELMSYRQTHTKEEYQDYVRSIVNEVKDRYNEEDLERMQKIAVKCVAKSTFEYIYKTKGSEAAAKFLNIIVNLKEVKFNEEVEEAYQRLYNEN